MKSETIRILMTGAGAPGCPSILNCLRNNGERELYIVGVDMNPMATCRTKVDKFYQVPAAADPTFIDKILEICRTEKIQVLISIVTRELELFSKAKERFAEVGTLVSTMDYGPLHIANNKGLLLTAMKAAGLPVPAFQVVHTPEALEEAVHALGYPEEPVVVKPTFGNGSRGTRILDARKSRYNQFFMEKPNSQYMRLEELMEIVAEKNMIPEMMVMEFLPGSEVSVDILADHGKVLYSSAREGRVVSSIMVSSEVKLDAEAMDIARKTVELLKLDGNIDFDMRRGADGFPYVMEINPRLPAGVAVQAKAGVNFPYLGIKKIMGEELPACRITEGYQMQFVNSEVFYDPSGNVVTWDIRG